MYLWKCWRDTRYQFLVACGGIVLVHIFYWTVATDWFGWFTPRAFGIDRLYWEQAAEATVKITGFLTVICGFIFASEGLAEEFPKKTLPLLLSRPRSRAYFLWVNWFAGALQVVFLVAFARFLHEVRPSMRNLYVHFDLKGGVFLRLTVALATMAIVFYCLTFLLGVILCSGRNGMRAAIGLIILYSILVQAWNVPLPTFYKLIEASLPAATPAQLSFPVMLCVGWLSFSLLMACAADVSFRRFDL